MTDWTEFGLNPQRSDATNRPTGITAGNVGHLRLRQVSLPGTVDSSPVYLHGARVAGGTRDVIVVTTTYGRTVAIDARTGKRLWTYTPVGYGDWAGGAQITNTSPIADPDRRFVYSASPDGLIHKLALSSGHEVGAGAWPASITRDATREKLGSALNIDGPDVIATTSGYIGDAPTYQGHVALISRASGRVTAVFNTLCADRRAVIVPTSCSQSDSAILSRGGAVVEPGGERLLVDTGNGDWNGRTDFGDSVLELTVPGLKLRQAFTPTNQQELNESDTDLGSSAPALLGHGRVMVAGKDGVIRVLDLNHLDGHARYAHHRLGGEVQTLTTPNGGELFTAPAVWHHGSKTTVFVADNEGTAAFALRRGRLHPLWSNSTPGTSPIVAGGLLYVYDPSAGGIDVYSTSSSDPIAKLPGSSGHWNSPIVVDGHVVEPEGDANDHATTGTLELFTAR
ncbi:MAG TPA: PQQ-binding-like beta-propeller repeat protein [Solirubrobacterales bacterium]|nr:PQQ-binding-like beta-propeller repeat protein [Solirubrobacterales bacterium]